MIYQATIMVLPTAFQPIHVTIGVFTLLSWHINPSRRNLVIKAVDTVEHHRPIL